MEQGRRSHKRFLNVLARRRMIFTDAAYNKDAKLVLTTSRVKNGKNTKMSGSSSAKDCQKSPLSQTWIKGSQSAWLRPSAM